MASSGAICDRRCFDTSIRPPSKREEAGGRKALEGAPQPDDLPRASFWTRVDLFNDFQDGALLDLGRNGT